MMDDTTQRVSVDWFAASSYTREIQVMTGDVNGAGDLLRPS